MTTTVNRTADRGGPTVPAPGVLARLPRRRRWGLFALGVVLVALCAVIAYLLVVTAGVTRAYLAVGHDVPYGTTISAGDLVVVNVNPAAGLSPIPASDRDQVVGKHAAADLFAGTLLTRAQLTDKAIPAPGEQLVGIELKPGQLPARALRPGDAVILVVVPPTGLAGVPDTQSGGTSRPSTIPATVAGTAPPQTNGNVRVDVAVSQSDGPTVASMAAAGRLVIVLTTRN
ncbi:SAF domain-containing protein [Micromonospora globbae]|uniref:SAF domain-containing protein n=1 Tax=Micromonospora globbae TaxID=1894969 RepID=UPI003438CA92